MNCVSIICLNSCTYVVPALEVGVVALRTVMVRTVGFAALSLVACGTEIESTPTSGEATATSQVTEVPTATAMPNRRPSVDVDTQSVVNEVGRMQVPVTVEDLDGDSVDLTFLYTTNDQIFLPCTRANGSGNTVGLASGEQTTFLWDIDADIFEESSVTVVVIPHDGSQDGFSEVVGSYDVVPTEETGEPGTGTGDEHEDLGEEGGYVDPQGGDNSFEIALNADGEGNNQEEEFLLVLVNLNSADTNYVVGDVSELDGSTPTPTEVEPTVEEDSTPTETATAEQSDASSRVGSSQWKAEKLAWAQKNPVVPSARAAAMTVGTTIEDFYVIQDLEEESYTTRLAVLGAAGDSVNIFVDMDIPIDWDYNCDGVINLEDGDEYDRLGRESYGFDNCDLVRVTEVFSKNILENLREVFGYESDIDENGAVSVLLTPVLNGLSIKSEDGDSSTAVEVLAYPESDLSAYDSNDNVGSNEQEIFYLPAPDPAGFFNSETGGGGAAAIDEYVTFTMAANLAKATQSLISYNRHVLNPTETGSDERLSGSPEGTNQAGYRATAGEQEEEWLDAALGALAADLTGFGAGVYEPLFSHLAAPNLIGVSAAHEEQKSLSAAYLIVRYLYDRYGVEFIEGLMTGSEVGVENISAVIEDVSDGKDSFKEVMLDIATNLYLQDYQNSRGESLLNGDDVIPFLNATTIPVTDTTDYPGAEGFQQGINIFGPNVIRSAEDGSVEVKATYTLNGSRWGHYAPGTPFEGYLGGTLAIHGVRIGGLIDIESVLAVAADGDVAMRVIRLPNVVQGGRTFVVEQVFGSRSTTSMPLNVRLDGWPSVALGDVDPTESMVLLDTGESVPVSDTDLFTLDLSTYGDSIANLEIMAVRKPGEGGVPSLDDILVAIAPRGDVPNAENIQGDWDCGGAVQSVDYSYAYLEYLYHQSVLTSELLPTSYGLPDPDYLDCDFDGDGKADGVEARPQSLVDQIQTWQDEMVGATSSIAGGGFYPYVENYQVFTDTDSVDEDSEPFADAEAGINTRTSEAGEEGYLRVSVPAGSEGHIYTIIVGGPDSVGPYELSVRLLSEDN